MPRATLATMKAEALQLADVPPESSSRTDAPITDAELNSVVNRSLADLHETIAGVYQDYFTYLHRTKLEARREHTTLPPYFLQLRALYLVDNDERVLCEEFHLDDFTGRDTTDYTNRPKYRIMGQQIRWLPMPERDFPLEIWMTRAFHQLLNDGDEIDPEIPEGWERFVVFDVAAYCLAKLERDPAFAMAERERVRRSIEALARNRDNTGPRSVHDSNWRFTLHPYRRRRILPWPTKRV